MWTWANSYSITDSSISTQKPIGSN